MRIAVVVFEFPALSETFALNQITGLIERGHDVDIYALNGPPAAPSPAHPDVEKFRLLERTAYAPNLPRNRFARVLKAGSLVCSHLRRIPGPALRSLNVASYGRQAASMSLLATAVAFSGKGDYDIILNQFGTVGLLTLPLREFGMISGKLVTFFRGADVSRFVRAQGTEVYSRLFEEGDLFLTNCNFFRQRLLDLGCDGGKLFVHGSGVDCDRFAFAEHVADGSVIRIATTGRLVEKKGIEYGIRAVAKLIQGARDVEYNLIGDGPLRGRLESLVKELGIQEAVRFHGAKCQRSIVDVLRRASVFIAPCVTASNGDQDAPVNSLKEAMAMGVPVIGTQHGGIPELIEDGVSGFVVPERDPAALADRIAWLADHPQLTRDMTVRAREYVESHYDTDRLNDRLVERLQQLFGGNSASAENHEWQVAPVAK